MISDKLQILAENAADILDMANAVTEAGDTNIYDAVGSLIEGYGGEDNITILTEFIATQRINIDSSGAPFARDGTISTWIFDLGKEYPAGSYDFILLRFINNRSNRFRISAFSNNPDVAPPYPSSVAHHTSDYTRAVNNSYGNTFTPGNSFRYIVLNLSSEYTDNVKGIKFILIQN